MADSKKLSGYDTYDWKKAAAEMSYAVALVSGSDDLKAFFNEIAGIIKRTGYAPTQQEFNKLSKKHQWFQDHDANQQAALLAEANDPTNYKKSLEVKATAIREAADQIGVPLDDAAVTDLAKLARYNGWTDADLRKNLTPYLQAAVGTDDLTGQAGDYQTQLSEWIAQNGLDIPQSTINAMVTKGAFGKQSIQDMQAELRKTYLSGAYPAWADKINAGMDPSVLASPYMGAASKLLELGDNNSVSINDPLIKKAMQSVGPDGKPVQMPLYEFEQMVRKDPRWQKTDNAYATYANVARNVLSTFGFGG